MLATLTNPIRRLYNWSLEVAAHRHARWYLAAVSFADSSFFPIPPDVMLIPMALADRARAFGHAAICTIASVLGALFGYAIGALVFELVARPILALYGYEAVYENFGEYYREYGAWIVIAGGFTPLPFKVITIASGTVSMNLAIFILAATLSRGARFFLVAGLLYWIGPPIRDFIDRHLPWLSVLGVALLLGGFLALAWLI